MSAYAVVKVGSRQFRVEENQVFDVDLFEPPEKGDTKLEEVLFVGNNGESKIGQPLVKNAAVICEVVGQVKAPKVISFKYKRRKTFRKKIGHRQPYIRLRVKSIEVK